MGSNLVDALRARGVRVAVVDDRSSGRRENLSRALEAGATLHELDITEASAMRHVFVRDVVAATPAAADAGLEGPDNIGCGRETSVRRLLAAIVASIGAEAEPDVRPGFSEGDRRSCLDSSRAQRDLAWTARTTLEDSIGAPVAAIAVTEAA